MVSDFMQAHGPREHCRFNSDEAVSDWSVEVNHVSVSERQSTFHAHEPYESATKVYVFQTCAHSSTLQRWMQEHPMGYVDGMTLYAYVGNHSVQAVDPSGLAEGEPTPPNPPPPSLGPGQKVGDLRPLSVTSKVTLVDGAHGKVTVSIANDIRIWSASQPSAMMKARYDDETIVCPAGPLKWKQTVQITINNSGNMTQAQIEELKNEEINEHHGDDPFKRPVLDFNGDDSGGVGADGRRWAEISDYPSMMPKRFQQKNRANLGKVNITKSFVATLYVGEQPAGVSVSWSFTGDYGADTSVVNVMGP